MKIYLAIVPLFCCFIIISTNLTGQDTTGAYARQKYEQALKERSMHKIIRALYLTGNAYKKQNLDSAYITYDFALNLSKRFRINSFIPQLYFEMAMLQNRGFNYKAAVELFDSSRNTALRMGDVATVSNVLNMLGTLQLDLWNEEEARILFDSAYKIASKSHLFLQAGVALGNMARFYTNPDSAVIKMKQAISIIARSQGVHNESAYIYVNIGNLLSNPDSAIYYFEKAVKIGQHISLPEISYAAYNNMAYSYLDKNDPEKASGILERQAIPLAIGDSNFDWLATLYDTWSDVKAAQNDFSNAWNFEKEAWKAQAEAERRKSSSQVRLLIKLLEVGKKESLLSASKLKVATQEDAIKNLRFLIFIIVAIAILGALIFLLYYQKMKLKDKEKELDLIRREIEIEDRERKRIAMQLHDLSGSLDQKMLGKIERLTGADPAVRDSLVMEWKNASSVIHAVSYHMNRDLVEALPFADLVGSIFEEFRNTSHLTFDLKMDAGMEFPARHQFHLSFIIRELLSNAAKHVREGTVSCAFSSERGIHYLVYRDTGPGFDSEKKDRKTMGLNNIFERSKLMGGHAAVQTKPGIGTKWIIVIPDENNEQQ